MTQRLGGVLVILSFFFCSFCLASDASEVAEYMLVEREEVSEEEAFAQLFKPNFFNFSAQCFNLKYAIDKELASELFGEMHGAQRAPEEVFFNEKFIVDWLPYQQCHMGQIWAAHMDRKFLSLTLPAKYNDHFIRSCQQELAGFSALVAGRELSSSGVYTYVQYVLLSVYFYLCTQQEPERLTRPEYRLFVKRTEMLIKQLADAPIDIKAQLRVRQQYVKGIAALFELSPAIHLKSLIFVRKKR